MDFIQINLHWKEVLTVHRWIIFQTPWAHGLQKCWCVTLKLYSVCKTINLVPDENFLKLLQSSYCCPEFIKICRSEILILVYVNKVLCSYSYDKQSQHFLFFFLIKPNSIVLYKFILYKVYFEIFFLLYVFHFNIKPRIWI